VLLTARRNSLVQSANTIGAGADADADADGVALGVAEEELVVTGGGDGDVLDLVWEQAAVVSRASSPAITKGRAKTRFGCT